MARSVGTRLQAVGEEELPPLIGDEPAVVQAPVAAPVSRETSHAQSVLTGLLLTSLRTLSQRTVVALASLVDLALIGSAFALWLLIIAAPTPLQLVAVGLYALLVLIAVYMRRK